MIGASCASDKCAIPSASSKVRISAPDKDVTRECVRDAAELNSSSEVEGSGSRPLPEDLIAICRDEECFPPLLVLAWLDRETGLLDLSLLDDKLSRDDLLEILACFDAAIEEELAGADLVPGNGGRPPGGLRGGSGRFDFNEAVFF